MNTTSERYLSDTDFVIKAEDGTLTREQFDFNVQRFVDGGLWRSLQGSWQRVVTGWAAAGLVDI